MNYVLDDFKETGTDLKDFALMAEIMDMSTTVVPFQSDDLTIMHYAGLTQIKRKQHLKLVSIEQGDWYTVNDISKGFKVRNFSLENLNISSKIISELEQNRLIYYRSDDSSSDVYFASKIINKTYSGFQKEVGGEILKYNDMKKAVALSLQLYLHPFTAGAVIRQQNDCKKIFALHSLKYQRYDLINLYHSIKGLKDIFNVKWTVTNMFAELYFEFKKVGDYSLGLSLKASDTSHCKNSVTATIRKNNLKECFYVAEREIDSSENKPVELSIIEELMEESAVFLEKKLLPVVQKSNGVTINTEKDWLKYVTNINKKTGFAKLIGARRYNALIEGTEIKVPCTGADVYEAIFAIQENNSSQNQVTQMKDLLKSLFKISGH